jgi:MinD superfamily P-loop ATPase
MNIAIASGKGGTGKTLVSTNLFWAAQKVGLPVTIVDCDAEEPNVTEFIQGEVFASSTVSQKIPVIDPEQCVFCGKCHEYCNYHAIVYLPPSGFIQVVEELCHDCGACSVACEFGAITEKEKKLGTVQSIYLNCHAQIIEGRAEVGVYSPVPVIKKAIKEANDKTLNIFDSPPGISCPFIATVDKADYVVLVTEPTPFGLNDLKLSVETLQHLGKPFGVIVNRANLGDDAVYKYLQKNNIALLMEIPMDREIARIYSEGRMLVDEKPEFQSQFIQLYKTINQLNKALQTC